MSKKVTLSGMAAETVIENVFICDNCDAGTVIVEDAESVDCPMCKKPMENSGWFEAGVNRKGETQ